MPPSDSLRSDFLHIPEHVSKPWCYYYWIEDDVSKDGITKDLQAMRAAGIGTALIGNINPALKNGKLPMLSPAWWDAMVHAVNEGKRLGIDIGVFNCPGWSQSGGPWIDATMTMQHLLYSETNVKGGGRVRVTLPSPRSDFKELYTLAFPTIQAEKNKISSIEGTVSTSPVVFDARACFDGDTATFVELPAGRDSIHISIRLKKPLTPQSLSIYAATAFRAEVTLFSQFGGAERELVSFDFDRSNPSIITGPMPYAPVAISLPELTSQEFTLVLKNIKSSNPKKALAEIVFNDAPVLERYVEKQLGKMHPTPLPLWNTYIWDQQAEVRDSSLIVDTVQTIDVTRYVSKQGELNWDAPPGVWTIMRVGMAPTGVKNHPAAPAATGYEVDKLDREKVKIHFENFVGELRRRIPPGSQSALKYVVIDSYEVGSQNWREGYREKFLKRYGYDPLKYLPVISGRLVGSVQESERFLWDLRRVIADDVADEYVGGMQAAARQAGMSLWMENYGHWGFPSEFLRYGGRSDLVSGEFWNEGTLGDIECKAASSAAHTYGKQMVSAEGFTSSQYSFLRHPAMLKKRGDWSFTEGINHLVLHVYIHQPDDNRKPGVNAWFGTEFNRHNTWFEMARGWTDYLRRCHLMLQQGQYAADVCYYIGEDAPMMTGGRNPEIPDGYSYDYINAEVLLKRMTVNNGRLTLPDGMSYSLMVLPPVTTMRPAIASKLLQLVRQGGKILGPRPQRSPSLEGQPQADKRLWNTLDSLWGQLYTRSGSRRVGDGYIFTGMDLQRVFSRISLTPDVTIMPAEPVKWTHRTEPSRDIYFLTNQAGYEVDCNASFRLQGRRPQLWDPMTGETRFLNQYDSTGGRITIPIRMDAYQSLFIVFEQSPDPDLSKGYTQNFPQQKMISELKNGWALQFSDKTGTAIQSVRMDSLTDLRFSNDSAIRYFAGKVKYTTSFLKPPGFGDEPVYMNLGEVAVMASVSVNGKPAGITWMKPHRLRIDHLLLPGSNTVEIEVVNLWRNKMIREVRKPASLRKLYWVYQDVAASEKLHPSGLIGPVTLEVHKN